MWVVIPFFSRYRWQMLCSGEFRARCLGGITEGQAVKAERPNRQIVVLRIEVKEESSVVHNER